MIRNLGDNMPEPRRTIVTDPASPPTLVVTVDTEAEFNWDAPYSRDQTAVGSVSHQQPAQHLMAAYGIVPTYLVDSAVVANDAASEALSRLRDAGGCAIGAHLNPWLAPPFDESLSAKSSFAGALPAALERAKLACLTDRIRERFGAQPRVYRAGRFGIGPNTPVLLQELGYQVDMSVAPYSDFSHEGGPDFSDLGPAPFWSGCDGGLLEIPVTWGYSGRLAERGRPLHRWADSTPGAAAHLPALLARLGIVEFVRLTPEGETFAALRKLTETLLDAGTRVFSLSYHSPSLVPGNTPYVRSDADLARFLDTLDRYFAYFFGERQGITMTPLQYRAFLLKQVGGSTPGQRNN